MADTHTLLAKQGYASVMLVPADEGLREMYRKMGYEDGTGIGELTCTAGDFPARLRSIGAEEYAALRRRFLPEKSVLQEGISLTFLAAQAQLFSGPDFLLAAWREENVLHGMELLGNTAAAPQILHSLGCETGHFQIPGNTRPFAMIRKLQETAQTPEYFGLAFE